MKPLAPLLTSRQMAFLGPSLRRRRVTERPGSRAAAALLLSLALNALLVWLLVAGGVFAPPAASAVKPVVLAPLTADQWNANRALSGSARPLPAPVPRPPVAPPPRQEELAGKVVELPPDPSRPKDQPPPATSRFLSDRNNRVDKETVSRYAAPRPENLAPVPQAGSPGRVAAGEDGKAERAQKGKEGVSPRGTGGERLAIPEQPARERLALAPRGPGGLETAPREERQGIAGGAEGLSVPGEPGEGGERAKGRSDAKLTLEPGSLARIAGGPSMDGYHDAEEGEGTFLNTREFRFATYLNQVRRAIGEDWYPRVRTAVRDRDPDGKFFFYKERTVVLGVTLDPGGHVRDLSVLQSSNVDFFDRVAIASVQKAQPFPNPPNAMFDREGAARFPFVFTLYPADRRAVLLWKPPTGE